MKDIQTPRSVSVGFLCPSWENFASFFKTDGDRCLPNPFQFIIHK